jgi:hypothetical protein
MKGRFRVFSLKRLLLSIVLGFLIPFSYALILFKLGRLRRSIFEIVIAPIRWPFSLVMFFLGRQPTNAELPAALIFLIVCNVALYGSLIYLVLLAVAAVRRKRAVVPPPPLPNALESVPTDSSTL